MFVRSLARASRVAGCVAVTLALVLAVAGPASARPQPVDRTAPTAPANLRVTTRTRTSVSLAWNPSTDNVGVRSYSLWGAGLSGVVSVAHPQTTGTVTGLRPGQTVTFRVQAFDAAFNGSPISNTVTATTVPDTAAPAAPTGLAVVAVQGSKVQLRWNSGVDDVGPVTHQVLVDGVPTANALSTTAPGTFPRPSVDGAWVRQLEPSTSYRFSVRATDVSGNVSGTSNVVTATTGPSSDVTPPTTPVLLSGFDGGPGQCPEELWLRWSGSTDDVDPATAIDYEVRINGRINEVDTGFTGTVTYTEVAGPNTVTIVAVDRAGNASAPSNAITITTSITCP